MHDMLMRLVPNLIIHASRHQPLWPILSFLRAYVYAHARLRLAIALSMIPFDASIQLHVRFPMLSSGLYVRRLYLQIALE